MRPSPSGSRWPLRPRASPVLHAEITPLGTTAWFHEATTEPVAEQRRPAQVHPDHGRDELTITVHRVDLSRPGLLRAGATLTDFGVYSHRIVGIAGPYAQAAGYLDADEAVGTSSLRVGTACRP